MKLVPFISKALVRSFSVYTMTWHDYTFDIDFGLMKREKGRDRSEAVVWQTTGQNDVDFF